MRNIILQLFLTLFTLALPFSAFCNDDSTIKFVNENSYTESKTSFNGIQNIAFEEDKPIFITFHAVWSSSCQKMRREVFSNEKVAQFMNANFINYSANIESKLGSALAEYYDIYNLPTTLIITPKGKVIVKNEVTANHKQFLRWAKEANNSYFVSKQTKINAVQQSDSFSPRTANDARGVYVPKMVSLRTRRNGISNR